MNEIVEAKLQKVSITSPEMVKLKIGGLRAKHAHIEDWGWVHVQGVLEVLQRIFHGDIGKHDIFNTSSEIFDRFGLLCNQDGEKPLLTWVCGNEYLVDGTDHPNDDQAYIPAGWWERILWVTERSEKIINVTTEPHTWEQQESIIIGDWRKGKVTFLGPFCRHQLVGTYVNGTKVILKRMDEEASTTKSISRIMLLPS